MTIVAGPCASRVPSLPVKDYDFARMNNRTVLVPKPLYETLPYAYMVAGLLAIVGSYFLAHSLWADLVLVLGVFCVLGGAVILLKRRDFRRSRSEHKYTGGALNERELG